MIAVTVHYWNSSVAIDDAVFFHAHFVHIYLFLQCLIPYSSSPVIQISCIQLLVCMFFLFGWPPCQRSDIICMEVSQRAYDMNHYISGLCGYLYVCEMYVNLIWYLYLFMLNKICLSLSLSLSGYVFGGFILWLGSYHRQCHGDIHNVSYTTHQWAKRFLGNIFILTETGRQSLRNILIANVLWNIKPGNPIMSMWCCLGDVTILMTLDCHL